MIFLTNEAIEQFEAVVRESSYDSHKEGLVHRVRKCQDVKRRAAFKMAEAALAGPPGAPTPASWNFQIKQFL